MQDHLIIRIPAYPPSANRQWRKTNYGRVYLSKEAEDFNKATKWALVESNQMRVPKDWKYYNVYIVLHPARRSGDVDNREKPVLDALTKAGFWNDDKYVGRCTSDFGDVRKTACISVLITPRTEKYKAKIEGIFIDPKWDL